MRWFQRKCCLYVLVAIVSYATLTYFYLHMSSFSNITSVLRHFMTSRVSGRAYGYGTIMVDVNSLARMRINNDVEHVNMKLKEEKKNTKLNVDISKSCFRVHAVWKENITGVMNSRTFRKKSAEKWYGSEITEWENTYGDTRCNCYITLDVLPGRSGNQLFQLAALLGIAYQHDLIPVINSQFPLSEWFDLPNLIDLNLTNTELFTVKQSGVYSEDVDNLDMERNWTIRGYFQSWKYFRNAERIVKQALKLKLEYLDVAMLFIGNVSVPGAENVCIHVRRGDLNDNGAIRKGYAIAGLDYIHRAMDYYRKTFKNVQFIVSSDGIFWCKKHIKMIDVIFSPFNRHAEDMALMTLCDHVIVTSGTFGWWGAWLSGGTTVYFRGYPRPGSWLGSQINNNDYYPAHWKGM